LERQHDSIDWPAEMTTRHKAQRDEVTKLG
jgi:hypothetical protein